MNYLTKTYTGNELEALIDEALAFVNSLGKEIVSTHYTFAPTFNEYKFFVIYK